MIGQKGMAVNDGNRRDALSWRTWSRMRVARGRSPYWDWAVGRGMMAIDGEKILVATDAIRRALMESTDAWGNTTARREIEKEATAIMRYASADGFLRKKVGSISFWIDVLFSRKHESYKGGITTIKKNLLEDLHTIESYVKNPRPG